MLAGVDLRETTLSEENKFEVSGSQKINRRNKEEK
jgi:hypothetical protein